MLRDVQARVAGHGSLRLRVIQFIEFLREIDEPERSTLLKELLTVELAYRGKNGETRGHVP